MYSTGAPRNWADLRSQQGTIITCVDPSYSSAVDLPHPLGGHSLDTRGAWCGKTSWGVRVATRRVTLSFIQRCSGSTTRMNIQLVTMCDGCMRSAWCLVWQGLVEGLFNILASHAMYPLGVAPFCSVPYVFC